jgi:hypothetical protein
MKWRSRELDSLLLTRHRTDVALLAMTRLENDTIAMLTPVLRIVLRPGQTCRSNFKPSSRCYRQPIR